MTRKPSLPYLESRKYRGRVYWYFRRRGEKSTRLPDPSDPPFLAAYEEARRGKPKVSRTSIGALVDLYIKSPGFAEKAHRTQRDYLDVLEHIKAVAGTHDVSRITMPAVIQAMENNRHRVRFANYLGQMYRQLCRYAVKIGWLARNPLADLELIRTPKDRLKEHVPWTDLAVDTWREKAHPMARLAFELGVGTTQRPGDLCRMRWSSYDGESIHVWQSKTNHEGVIPCTPQLKTALDRAEKRGLTILTNAKGQPLTYAALSAMMREERRRLGLMAYDLHALRYRGIMELAWAGCDDDQIASFSLHTSKAMIVKYAGRARQITRAREAAEKRRRK